MRKLDHFMISVDKLPEENESKYKKRELEVLEKMYEEYSDMTNNIYKIIQRHYKEKKSNF